MIFDIISRISFGFFHYGLRFSRSM